MIWAIKHKSISATFVDEGAAQFFLPHLNETKKVNPVSKHLKYTVTPTQSHVPDAQGSALGPDWAYEFRIAGKEEAKGVRNEGRMGDRELGMRDEECFRDECTLNTAAKWRRF